MYTSAWMQDKHKGMSTWRFLLAVTTLNIRVHNKHLEAVCMHSLTPLRTWSSCPGHVQQTPLCPPFCLQREAPSHDSPRMLWDVHLHLPEPAASSCKAPVALLPTQTLAGDARCSPVTGASITPCPLGLRESHVSKGLSMIYRQRPDLPAAHHSLAQQAEPRGICV